MFNLSGSELIFLVLIALVVLGPDKLPEAMRKAGKAYADFKKLTNGFQSEMKAVLDEPMRELRETAELAKQSAMFDINGTTPKPDQKPASASIAPPASERPSVEEALAKLEVKGAPTPVDATSIDPRIIAESPPVAESPAVAESPEAAESPAATERPARDDVSATGEVSA